MHKWLLYLFTLVLLFTSCEKVDTTQSDLTFDTSYFPQKEGLWRVYRVTSIEIDEPSNVFDTNNYYIKEIYGNTFSDAADDTMHVLNRYYRDSLNQNWKELDVWSSGIVNNQAVQVEENIRYIKMVFPVQLEKEWNGNAYNRLDTLNEFNYTITSLNVPETINGLSFDSVMQITQREKSSLVDKIYFYEKYAKNTGMVERVQVSIYSENVDPNIPIERRITQGILFTQTIIDYGK